MRLILLLSVCLLITACAPSPTDVATVDDPGASDMPSGPDLGDGPENAVPVADELTPVAVTDGVATLSAENTKIQFVGIHEPAQGWPRTGVFTEFTGKAEVDADSELVAVSAEIKTESLTTGIDGLNNHLLGTDFFSVRDYPVAKFESTAIGHDGEAYTVTGNLTLLATTKELTFPATVTVDDAGVTLVGELTIDRTEFGMDQVQDRVQKEIALSIVIGQKSELPEGSGGGFGGRGGGGGGGQQRDPAAMFAGMDGDSDGKLVGDEIPIWIANNLAEIDSNSDGEISQEELVTRMSQFRTSGGGGGRGGRGGGGGGRGGGGGGRGGGGFDPSMMFANWDADGDGKLTGDEINDWMREGMEETDTDKDGAITLEEFQARIQRRRAAGGFGGGGGRGGGGRRGGGDRPERPQRPATDD
jgi:polyisoprenoid-binding protein YceI